MGLFRDKVVVNRHSSTTHVTEKRAPTDESVKLLKEFEEKAESKFIDRIDVKTNLFEYTMLEYAQSFDFMGYKFFYYCKINGEGIKGDVSIDRMSKNPRRDILNKVHESITSKIVSKIVLESVDNMLEATDTIKF